MKKSVRKIMSAMLVLCMAMTVILGSVTEAQAASKYTKSISKKIKITDQTMGDPTVLTFVMKKAGTVSISFTCPEAKEGEYYKEAFVQTSGEMISAKSGAGNRPAIANYKGYNTLTMKVKFKKGYQTITVTGHPNTYKIKLTTKSNVMKYKSLEHIVGGEVG